jgi:cell division protein FtsB
MWLGVLVVVVVAVVVLFEPVQIWFEQQVRIGQLRAEVTNSKVAVASMQEELKRWGDRAYVEAQARQRLLFVYPGDVSYLIVNDIVVDESVAVGAAAAVRTTDINWVDALLASYIAAAGDQEPK